MRSDSDGLSVWFFSVNCAMHANLSYGFQVGAAVLAVRPEAGIMRTRGVPRPPGRAAAGGDEIHAIYYNFVVTSCSQPSRPARHATSA